MKKTIITLISLISAALMLLCFSGCGTNAKKQEAIDAFNKTSNSFTEVANLINDNADSIDDEVITTFQDMSSLLSKYKENLESDLELTDEEYDKMIKWFGEAEDWIKESKTELENGLSNLEQ